MLPENLNRIVHARVNDPGAVATAAARRVKATSLRGEHGKAMIIAADHPARGANGVGADPHAMADRFELLDRLCVALERPGVTGVLGTADILEDLPGCRRPCRQSLARGADEGPASHQPPLLRHS
ncbi:hypothetical protein ABZ646_41695, partial [Streptomyces sp. NPDC007162]